REHDRKISIRQGQPEAVPGLGNGDRELRSRPIIGPRLEFIQSPTVIAAEAFGEIVSDLTILAGLIDQIMARKFVQTVRNKHVLVNVKWRRDPLSKYVHDIGVNVGAIVEIGAESA